MEGLGQGYHPPKDKSTIRVMAVGVPRARRHSKKDQMLKERKPKTKAMSRFLEECLRGKGCLLSEMVDVQSGGRGMNQWTF